MGNVLVIFAKAPRLGTVKTRLQATLPARTVRNLYLAFLQDTLETALQVRAVTRRILAFTPDDGESLLRQAIGSKAAKFEFVPQHGRHLGERMRHAIELGSHSIATRTVIIGADSPSLPARRIEEAFAVLARTNLVLGPSVDGGFYLLGVRRGRSAAGVEWLTRRIQWSTARTLEQTVAAARRSRWKVQLLAPWYDVDDAAALRFLKTHLGVLAACGVTDLARHTRKAIRAM